MGKKIIQKKQTGFNLSALSSTRDLLFGLATLMVVLFHSYISIKSAMPNAPVLAEILTLIREHCNKAVDMFLFMSGIGLYYSMSSNPKLKDFYKKRATRILPAVLIVSVIWFALREPQGLNDFLNKVFFVSFFTEGTRYFWYFILIIFLYAIYPLIHKLYNSTGTIGMLCSVAIVIGLNFLLKETTSMFYLYTEIALTRIPVFLIGAWAGKYVKEEKRISYLWIALAAVAIIGIYIFYYFEPFSNLLHLYRYIGGIFAICHILVFSALFSKCRFGGLGTFLVWLGGYSMELYLVHEKITVLMYNDFRTHDPSRIVYYSATFVIAMMAAMALKAMCTSLDKNLFYRNSLKNTK